MMRGYAVAALLALASTAMGNNTTVTLLRGSEHERRQLAAEPGLKGQAFLNGIKRIIGNDPQVPREEVDIKPFMGSFSTIKSEADPAFANTGYCLTDEGCGTPLPYITTVVPLSALSCNKFCYIDTATNQYAASQLYTTSNPPASYLCCGWGTC